MKLKPAEDWLLTSLTSWGIFTTEDAAMMPMPRAFEMARVRQRRLDVERSSVWRRVVVQCSPKSDWARFWRGAGRFVVMVRRVGLRGSRRRLRASISDSG